jgi:hypothetical protein
LDNNDIKLSVVMDTSNLTKKQIDTTVRNLRDLDCRAYKQRSLMRLEFGFNSAMSVSLEEFVSILSRSTKMKANAVIRNKMLCFKFSKIKRRRK